MRRSSRLALLLAALGASILVFIAGSGVCTRSRSDEPAPRAGTRNAVADRTPQADLPVRARRRFETATAPEDGTAPPHPVTVAPYSPTATTRVRVTDRNGVPVAGACVQAWEVRFPRRAEPDRQAGIGTTPEDGSVSFDQPRSEDWRFVVSAAGFIPAHTSGTQSGRDVLVRLERATRVRFSIAGRSSSGRTYDVRVHWFVGNVRHDIARLRFETDVFDVAVPVSGDGETEVTVLDDEGASASWRRAPWGDAEMTHTLEMSPPTEIRGVVIAAGTREPVEGAWVRAGGQRATTGASGEFVVRFPGSPESAARTSIAAGGPGFASRRVPLGGCDLSAMRLELASGLQVRFRPTGAGPGDAPASVESWEADAPHARRRSVSDGTGREVVIGELVPGRQYFAKVEVPGHAPTPVTFVAGHPCMDVIDVPVVPQVLVAGQLVRPDGEPEADARCELNLVESQLVVADGLPRAPDILPLRSVPFMWFEGDMCVTDSVGRFELRAAPGVHSIRVLRSGRTTPYLVRIDVPRTAGERVDLGRLSCGP